MERLNEERKRRIRMLEEKALNDFEWFSLRFEVFGGRFGAHSPRAESPSGRGALDAWSWAESQSYIALLKVWQSIETHCENCLKLFKIVVKILQNSLKFCEVLWFCSRLYTSSWRGPCGAWKGRVGGRAKSQGSWRSRAEWRLSAEPLCCSETLWSTTWSTGARSIDRREIYYYLFNSFIYLYIYLLFIYFISMMMILY